MDGDSGTDPLLVLGAVVLGALISAATTYAMARRGERAAARATARILRGDLLDARAMLELALQKEQWWPREIDLPTRGWHEDRAPLALFVSDDEWRRLSTAFDEMRITNAMHPEPHIGTLDIKSDPQRERLRMTLQAAMEASGTLNEVMKPFRPWARARRRRA